MKDVILSEVAASRSEAATQSKDLCTFAALPGRVEDEAHAPPMRNTGVSEFYGERNDEESAATILRALELESLCPGEHEGLFVAKTLNGVQLRCFSGGIVPKDNSDAGGKQAANSENFGRQLGRKFEELFDNRG